jgi:hypothetical protein
MHKKINAKLRGELAIFVKEYSRKAQRGVEPNDRRYDRKMESLMKSMTPEELSDLLNEDEPKT